MRARVCVCVCVCVCTDFCRCTLLFEMCGIPTYVLCVLRSDFGHECVYFLKLLHVNVCVVWWSWGRNPFYFVYFILFHLYTFCIFLYGTTESVSLILLGSGGATRSGQYNYLKDTIIYLGYHYKHRTCRFALDHAADEDVDEPVERVLVHGVNVAHVGHTEEEDLRVDGHRDVLTAGQVDVLLCGIRRRHLGLQPSI